VRADAASAGELPRPWPGWCCSYCAAPLEALAHGLYCPAEGRFFATDAGIHRLLPEQRRRELLPRVELARVVRGPLAPARQRTQALEHALRQAWDRLGAGPWRVLDVGAGSCWASARLLRAAHRPVAVDVDLDPEHGLRGAERFLPGRVRLPRAEADMEALPLEPISFDLVLAVDVLHLAPRLDRLLIELRRVTRRGGLLVAFGSPAFRWRADGEAHVADARRRLALRLGKAPSRDGQEGYLALEDLAETFRGAGWRFQLRDWPGRVRERLGDFWGRVRRGRVPVRRPLLLAERDG
jgi:SAM-dependent methyltransferase